MANVDAALVSAFSEDWYLERYPDVRVAVQIGKIGSGLAHYKASGYGEGRMPFDIDSKWYLSRYPEAASSIHQGIYPTAAEHYARLGRYCGLVPKPDVYPNPAYRMRDQAHRVFALGAYGTNNIGDEAIFAGIRQALPNAVPIHLAKSNIAGSLFIEDVLKSDNLFEASDYLIIGGGGLFYDAYSSSLLLKVAQFAKARGATVDLLGVGLEAAQNDSFDTIRELVALSEAVTVRSSTSQKIFEQICGFRPNVQLDFAFSIGNSAFAIKKVDAGSLDIGVVTSGDYRENLAALTSLIQKTLGSNRDIRFFHIPHSKAYLNARNNDVISGQILWSSIEVFRGSREREFIAEPYEPDPLRLLYRYSMLDGVITRRYHGMVFSRIVGVPILAMRCDGLKNKSFQLDHQTEHFFACERDEELAQQFIAFEAACRESKKARLRRI